MAEDYGSRIPAVDWEHRHKLAEAAFKLLEASTKIENDFHLSIVDMVLLLNDEIKIRLESM